jgi:hypothetical protein
MPAAWAGPAEPLYTYGEIGFAHTDIGNGIDGDGLGLRGSYALHPNWHVVAGFEALGLSGSTDATLFNIGLGFNAPFRPGLDGVLRMNFVHANVDPPGPGSRDEDGFAFEALLRVMINPVFEVNGGVRYLDLDSSNTAVKIGALYEITNNFAVGGDLAVSGDGTSVFVGGRLYFDPLFTVQRARR